MCLVDVVAHVLPCNSVELTSAVGGTPQECPIIHRIILCLIFEIEQAGVASLSYLAIIQAADIHVDLRIGLGIVPRDPVEIAVVNGATGHRCWDTPETT